MSEEVKEIVTRDLGLATVLFCLYADALHVDWELRGDGKRIAWFKFLETPELQASEEAYWDGRLAIEPKRLLAAHRTLKAMVSQERDRPR